MDNELIKGTLALVVLALLSRRAMYGYEIASTVSRETEGDFQWKEGSLYPCLHKLERDGLVVSRWEEPEGQRRRKYYALTDAGRLTLAGKSAAWTRLQRAVNTILEKYHERA